MEFTNLDPLARRRRAKQEKGGMDLVRGLRASRVRLRGRPGAQPGGVKKTPAASIELIDTRDVRTARVSLTHRFLT